MVWEGFAEYLEELRKLPEDYKAEAEKLIEGEVNGAYVTVKAEYLAHVFTGTLAARLRVTTQKGGLALVSGSPLAWLFDHGSQVRHYYTVNGKKKSVGRMPANRIFSRTVGKARRTLSAGFRDMLLRKGAAEVTET